MTLDEAIITRENSSKLLAFIPTPEDIQVAKSFDGNITDLDLASQFLVAIRDIPKYALRLKSLLLKGDYFEKIDKVTDQIESIYNTCQILLDNEEFKEFITIVLSLGNQINQGTRHVACGFKMSTLPNLATTKGNGGVSLLQYLVDPNVLSFVDSFAILEESSQVNIDAIQNDIKMLKAQLDNLKISVEQSSHSNPPDTYFCEKFQKFLDENYSGLCIVENKCSTIKQVFLETAKRLGEDDKSMKSKSSEDFLSTIYQFSSAVKKCMKTYKEKQARMKKFQK